MSNKEKRYITVGKIATVVCIIMYVSYVVQIINNLHGIKGNPIQPFVAMINSALWVVYGFSATKPNWPIIISNIPGIGFGLIAALTCF